MKIKIEAFEMWIYSRMLRSSWTERISNEEVLKWMNKGQETIKYIKCKKLEYFSHEKKQKGVDCFI